MRWRDVLVGRWDHEGRDNTNTLIFSEKKKKKKKKKKKNDQSLFCHVGGRDKVAEQTHLEGLESGE